MLLTIKPSSPSSMDPGMYIGHFYVYIDICVHMYIYTYGYARVYVQI